MNSGELLGKVGIVTGASQGIGASVAKTLAASGASVMMVARTESKLRQARDEIKDVTGSVECQAADVSDSAQVESLRDQMKSLHKRIDFVVNCAGLTIKKSVVDLDEGDWDKVIRANLKSVFFMARAFGPELFRSDGEEHGKFVAFGSVGSSLGIPLSGAYCAAKGGVVQLVKVLAVEWARHRVNVNAVCPGYILTPLSEGVLKVGSTRDRTLSRIPLGAFGDVKDVAALVRFLVSQDSNYITGAELNIDGGFLSAAYTMEG